LCQVSLQLQILNRR